MMKGHILSGIRLLVSTAIFAVCLVIAKKLNDPAHIVVIIGGALIFIFSVMDAVVTHWSTGIYECPKCGKLFVPTLVEYIFSAPVFICRFLKCPDCGKHSLCKRRELS